MNFKENDYVNLKLYFQSKARQELLAFTKYTKQEYQINWHHKEMCKVLDKFVKKEIKKLMIFMPPRNGKSELVSRRLPAFIFGVNPNAKIIATSYSAELSSSMNRDVQRIIDSKEYNELFPDVNLFGKNVRTIGNGSYLRNSDIFEIVNHQGVYRSAGIGGGITGQGADFAIIDDPIKNQEEADSYTYRKKIYEWYTSTLYTRLEKNGSVLLTMTRWHEDDLAGRLLEIENDWTVIDFPAIKESESQLDKRNIGEPLWPEKYPLEKLMEIKKTVGSRVWGALYQQKPTALEGGIIKRSWIKFYTTLPDKFENIVDSWDCSFKGDATSDFVAGQRWAKHGSSFYLIHRIKDRLDFPNTIKAIIVFMERNYKPNSILIEDKANGPAIISILKKEIPALIAINPSGSKESRVNAIAALFEAGNIFLPHPTIAPWVGDFIEELVNFPNSRNDDEVDACSQALNRLAINNSGVFTKEMARSKIGTIIGSRKIGDQW